MAARIREIRDAIVARIGAHWNPSGNDAVSAAYTFDVYQHKLTGRRVWVVMESVGGNAVTRGEDANDYGYQVWFAERYTDPFDPEDETSQAALTAWMDARVDFVDEIAALLGNPRTVPFFPAEPTWEVWPVECNVTTVYDVPDLIELKLFVGVITLLLREEA